MSDSMALTCPNLSHCWEEFLFKCSYSAQRPVCFCFYPFSHSLRNTVAHNELITRPAWLWMVAASPRIKAANPQMHAQSNATERSFWHIRAKLILVWTYFGCFEAPPLQQQQQACLWRSSNLCWVRSKSKTKKISSQWSCAWLVTSLDQGSPALSHVFFIAVVVLAMCTWATNCGTTKILQSTRNIFS